MTKDRKNTFGHMRFPTLAQKYYSDTMFVKIKSLQQNQVYSNVYCPFPKKFHAPEAIMIFTQNVGVPQNIVTDGTFEETKGRSKEIVDKFRLSSRELEPYSHWQNLVEGEIRESKRLMNKRRLLFNSHARLWDYLYKWCVVIRRLTTRKILGSRSPVEKRLGDTPDIYEYALAVCC